MHAQHRNRQQGFTLIELLLVVGIVAILASVVIVAINPSRQLGNARDAERRQFAKELRNAQFQHLIDNGRFAADKTIPQDAASAIPICRARRTDSSCINIDPLVPTYIACIPYDGAETNVLHTGYRLYQESSRIQVNAAYLGSGASAAGGCERPVQPIAHWRFDETSVNTPAEDASGNGFAGIATGFAAPHGPSAIVPTVRFTDPRSLRFDGTSDYLTVTTTTLLNLNKTLTFAAWIFLETPISEDRDILMRSDGTGQNELAFSIEDTGVLALHIDGSRYESTVTVPTNQWVHIAASRNNATAKLYINGALNSTHNPGSKNAVFNSCTTLFIGADVDTGCTNSPDNHWRGYLDEVRIYNVTLTDTEIASLASGNP